MKNLIQKICTQREYQKLKSFYPTKVTAKSRCNFLVNIMSLKRVFKRGLILKKI